MKARYSLYIIKSLLTVVLWVGMSNFASAQRYDRLLEHSLWNMGANAASIRLDSLSMAEASLNASFDKGELRDYSWAPQSTGVMAIARGTKHLEKFSMRGAFAFSDIQSQSHSGSMLSNAFGNCFSGFGEGAVFAAPLARNKIAYPSAFPVDVMEFTPGRKTAQNYALAGAISVPISEHWLLGGDMDFSATNIAKRKDLRYTLYGLDIRFSPSLIYRAQDFDLGLSLAWSRKAQSVKAEQIGSAQAAPWAFFDEGLYYGAYQSWTGSAVHLSESGVDVLPLVSNSLSAALQFYANTLFFFELAFSASKGKIGERQSIWYNFENPSAHVLMAYNKGGFKVYAKGTWQYMTNYKNVLDRVSEGGINIVKTYGRNKLLERSNLGIELGADYKTNRFQTGARISLLDSRELALPRYPYTFGRQTLSYGLDAYALYLLGPYEFTLNAGVLASSIRDTQCGVSGGATKSGGLGGDLPYRAEEVDDWQMRLLESPKVYVGLKAVRYFKNDVFVLGSVNFMQGVGLGAVESACRINAVIGCGLSF